MATTSSTYSSSIYVNDFLIFYRILKNLYYKRKKTQPKGWDKNVMFFGVKNWVGKK